VEEEDAYSPDKDHNGTGHLSGRGGSDGQALSLAERERNLREDVENRLHQLEGMVSTRVSC
jgi:hypothetical protein